MNNNDLFFGLLKSVPTWLVLIWQTFISLLPAFIQIMTAIYTALLVYALLRDKYFKHDDPDD